MPTLKQRLKQAERTLSVTETIFIEGMACASYSGEETLEQLSEHHEQAGRVEGLRREVEAERDQGRS